MQLLHLFLRAEVQLAISKGPNHYSSPLMRDYISPGWSGLNFRPDHNNILVLVSCTPPTLSVELG